MDKLIREIRTTFVASEEITVLSVSHLKYTDAVLNEAMRIYPPVAFAAARVPPQGGAVACGRFIPEGVSIYEHSLHVGCAKTKQLTVLQTRVTINNLAMNRGSNFHRPDDFVPERWLADAPAEFAKDNKAAFQPMSVGEFRH